jgi:hypothetical protein
MKRIIALKFIAMILAAIACLFLSAYANYLFINYIIEQSRPKITVII